MNRQMHGQSIGRTLTRRCLLGASGGMAWLIGSCPAIAQRLLTDATERRRDNGYQTQRIAAFRPKDPKPISPARFAWTRCSRLATQRA